MSYQFLFRVSLLPCACLLPRFPVQSSCSPVGFTIWPLWTWLNALLSRILATSCPISFSFPHLLRACWNCVVLIASAVLPLVAHSLSSRSGLGFAFLPHVYPHYMPFHAGTEYGQKVRTSIPSHWKQEISGNPWKADVEFGLLRGRCDTDNLQVTEKPHEQNEVLVWYVWPSGMSFSSIFLLPELQPLLVVSLQEFVRSKFCSRHLQWGVSSWCTRWIFLWERDDASFSVPLCTERKIPHSLVHNVIIDREFPGAEYCLPEVSVCSSVLPSFDIQCEHPASSNPGRTPSWWGFLLLRDNLGGATVINSLGVDKELRIKAIWKHFYLRTLIANRGKSSWNLGYSGYSWSVVVPMDCLDVSQWGYNCA